MVHLAIGFSTPQPVERSLWCKSRGDDWWSVIVGRTFKKEDWVTNFRLSERTFLFLCDELNFYVSKQDTKLRKAIPTHKRVAVALWRLATNADYRTIGHLFGISKASVLVIVEDFCSAVTNHLAPKYIKIPTGNELKKSVTEFETKWGFPQRMGAVDGSHIPIKAPVKFHADYHNRKGWYSIILQGLVDSSGQFIGITVGWPGRVHDARVFANSSLYRKGQTGHLHPASMSRKINGIDIPLLVLADAAYPLLPWVMKPFTDNGTLSAERFHYTYRLSRARMIVENAFGRLKGRWRCLLKQNEGDIDRMADVIAACCVLHNICERNDETFDVQLLPLERFQEDALQVTYDLQAPPQDSQAIRRALVEYCKDNPL